ncbi:hypothetical protein H0H93_014912, partial [Arthromyces matolae]
MHHTKIYLALSIVAYLLSVTPVSASPLPSEYGSVPSVVGENASTSVPISVSDSKGEGNDSEVNADQDPIPSTSRLPQGVQMVADIKFPEGIPQDWRNDKMDKLVRSIKENVDWTDPAWTIETLRAIAAYIYEMDVYGLRTKREKWVAQEDWSKEALGKMEKQNLIKVIQKMWADLIHKREKSRKKRRIELLDDSAKEEHREKKQAEMERKKQDSAAEKAAIDQIVAQERNERAIRQAKRKAEKAKRALKKEAKEAERANKRKKGNTEDSSSR